LAETLNYCTWYNSGSVANVMAVAYTTKTYTSRYHFTNDKKRYHAKQHLKELTAQS